MGFLGKLFPDANARVVKNLKKEVLRVNAFEETIKALSDDALRAKTAEFRNRLAQGENLMITHEAFAVCRRRQTHARQRHYDVIMGGLVSQRRH
jgi:preprotein translocase subunit SecA